MTPQIQSLLPQAVQYFDQGNLDAAEQLLNKVLQMHAKNFDALLILGVIKGIKGEQQEAIRLFRKAVVAEPNNNWAQFNLAKALSETGKDEEAIPHHKKAVQLAPQHADAWLNYGVSLSALDRPADAAACYERLIGFHPEYFQAWSNLGLVLHKLERYEEALQALDKALSLNPQLIEAWVNKGAVLRKQDRFQEALQAYNQAFGIDASNADVWLQTCLTFRELRWNAPALDAVQRAIDLRPDDAQVWSIKGEILADLQRHAEAQEAFDRALALRPDFTLALLRKGMCLFSQKRFTEAIAVYEETMAHGEEPGALYAGGHWLLSKLSAWDWSGLEDGLARVKAAIEQGRPGTDPFPVIAAFDDPLLEKLGAGLYAAATFPDQRDGAAWPLPAAGERIKIGYFSADFHNHATMHLMAELFEKHDKSRFEIVGFSYGPPVEDTMRKRAVAAMDSFIDVREKNDQEIAAMARAAGIDIAVDLKGYTGEHRIGIFARGAAPVQVSYLGYPGTLGVPYMDYIIGDGVVIPAGSEAHYEEQVVRLPHSYQVNDRARTISDKRFTRTELGLPEDGFVFASFNNGYKLAPESFDIWMSLLHEVPGSVLWLLHTDSDACNRLREEARRRGVAAERLVFAPFIEPSQHLARYRMADLFLDTFSYNAHTNASDALWMGLPVVTRAGRSFAGRVAASLLSAAGVPELITHSNEEYQALALELARDREKLAAFRRRLDQQRLSSPLFDSSLFTRHLEQAYAHMHQRRAAGLPAEAFDVAA